MNKKGRLLAVVVLMASTPLFSGWVPLDFISPRPARVFPVVKGLLHQTGTKDPAGWGAYFRHHVPGYLVSGLASGPELLPEGIYRYDFYFVRRLGHFKSFIGGANDVVRVEVYDATAKEILTERTFQGSDFAPHQKKAIRKSIPFTTLGRAGHLVEPRIYWKGMAAIAVQKIQRVNLETPSGAALQEKADLFSEQMPTTFLDRGYVIVRRDDGTIVDQADAAIWTGLYAASLAMRYKTTQDPRALKSLESTLWALHRLYEAAPIRGTLVRYVKVDGHPLEESASKDTYTGFFYGVAQGLPYVQDPKLRTALLADIKNLADHFIARDLSFASAYGHSLGLGPSVSKEMLGEALSELGEQPRLRKKWMRILRVVQGYFWVHAQRPPASFNNLIHWLKKNDLKSIEAAYITVFNDVRIGIKKLQKNIHRAALQGPRQGLTETPYIKLDLMLLRAIYNLDTASQGKPFTSLEEIKIFPSQSLLALHIIKVAAESFPKPNPYDAYYHDNLYEGRALLRTVIQWNEIDDELLIAVAGETEAKTLRTSSSHLSYLALHDLILLEKDPVTRFKYQKLFEAKYRFMRNDGNAMLDSMHAAVGLSAKQLGMAWWSLDRYPIDRRGKGAIFWKHHQAELAAAFSGITHRKARDPLPPDLRPRDAFIWQRSAHSIYGDEKDWLYPPLDYLFAYWLARSAASVEAVTEKSR